MTLGDVVSSFASPSTKPYGLAFDGKHLWHSDWGTLTIYQLDRNGNILRSFPSPSTVPRDMSFDGNHLWVEDDDLIYQLDISGNILRSITPPAHSVLMLCEYVDGKIWTGGYFPNEVDLIDIIGNKIRSFGIPINYPNAICFDGKNLWITDVVNSIIYCFSVTGEQLLTFSSPTSYPRGITFDGKYLWLAEDGGTDRIYQISLS